MTFGQKPFGLLTFCIFSGPNWSEIFQTAPPNCLSVKWRLTKRHGTLLSFIVFAYGSMTFGQKPFGQMTFCIYKAGLIGEQLIYCFGKMSVV
jgi:hypothetical protein